MANTSNGKNRSSRAGARLNARFGGRSGGARFDARSNARAHEREHVSRAGDKLASVVRPLGLRFSGHTALDVGSSTGGFTQVLLEQGAAKVVAVELGSKQMHDSVKLNERVELHEKTDVLDYLQASVPALQSGDLAFETVVMDVSFTSARQILLAVRDALLQQEAGKGGAKYPPQIIVMVKPQFEAKPQQLVRGVVKNERMRRDILGDFEAWAKHYFFVSAKADSGVAGKQGNLERFYVLKLPVGSVHKN